MQKEVVHNRIIEIDIIRCIVIILLVQFHSFAPYTKGWEEIPDTNCNIQEYYWLGKFFYSGMLETFVMISGYIFSFTFHKPKINYKKIVLKKIKRLYFPTIIWGIIFILILGNIHFFTRPTFFISILNGIAHLWFLPMLFWCMVFELFIGRHIPQKYIFLLALLSAIPLPTVPILKLNLYYCFFFHLGSIIASNKQFIISYFTTKKFLFLCVLYIVAFFSLSYVNDNYILFDSTTPLLPKFGLIYTHNLFRFIYSIFAVFIFYYVGTHIRLSSTWRNIILSLSSLSFGIYILQEIILRILYYKLEIAKYIGDFMTPWIGFIITFILSCILSSALNKNKYTKTLLG